MSNALIHGLAFALPILAQSGQEIAGAEPFAISCTGHMEHSDSDLLEEPESGIETRIYIVDEKHREVAYWNPALAAAVPVCDEAKGQCIRDFYPARIYVEMRSRLGTRRIVSLDRQAGTAFDDLGGEFGFSFLGNCTRTAMPSPDTSSFVF